MVGLSQVKDLSIHPGGNDFIWIKRERKKNLVWVKPKGLPEVGQMAFLPSTAPEFSHKMRDVNTPFRLPRLYSGGMDQSPTSELLASYHNMDYITPSPEPAHYRPSSDVLQMSGSPLRVPLRSSYDYPRLKHALIAPKAAVTFTRSGRPVASRFRNSLVTKSDVVRPQTALSDTGSIRWTLGTSNSVNFDYTGRSRHQGPYSRGFTKRCMAPPNWVKMKYGRTHSVM